MKLDYTNKMDKAIFGKILSDLYHYNSISIDDFISLYNEFKSGNFQESSINATIKFWLFGEKYIKDCIKDEGVQNKKHCNSCKYLYDEFDSRCEICMTTCHEWLPKWEPEEEKND